MKQDFPSSMPRHEQLMRLDGGKTPGRKHQRRPGIRAKNRAKAKAKRSQAARALTMRKYKLAVASYFSGDLETYPEKP